MHPGYKVTLNIHTFVNQGLTHNLRRSRLENILSIQHNDMFFLKSMAVTLERGNDH